MKSRRKAIRPIYPSLLLQQHLNLKPLNFLEQKEMARKKHLTSIHHGASNKEGFIKDVLKNYVSWKRYYKLIKRTEINDKEYEKKKTVRLLSSYVDLQDHAIEKKARIMIEHFVSQTQREIQGKARAMLVTRSRLHAVRFKRKFDDIMREMKLPYGALVAFSGTVTDAETKMDYTKENMNNLGGKIDIPDALKLPQFRILIVANMYQTGFDEPLLTYHVC
jgi:type I restriction enzyme R subunit